MSRRGYEDEDQRRSKRIRIVGPRPGPRRSTRIPIVEQNRHRSTAHTRLETLDRRNGNPRVSSVTIVNYTPNLDPDRLIELIERSLEDEIIYQYRKHGKVYKVDSTKGVLGIENTENNQQAWERGKTDILLNGGAIDKMKERIIQSNADWVIENIKVLYYYDSDDFTSGSSVQDTPKPNWIKNNTVWKDYYIYNTRITCAAFAITYYLEFYHHGPKACQNTKKVTKILLTKAYNLQKEMGWGDSVSITQLKEFVDKYPQYRITLFDEGYRDKNKSKDTFTGKEFVYEYSEEQQEKKQEGSVINMGKPVKNAIYICLPQETRHYVPILYLSQWLTRNASRKLFCQECCCEYYNYQEHTCANRLQKIRGPVKCKYGCGQYHSKQRECSLTQCKTCANTYNRKDGFKHHRCLITFSGNGIEFSEDGKDDPKKYGLYVWDIESLFDVEISKKNHPIFEVDEQGYFTGEVEVETTKISRHVPILVCVKNVFSNETYKFYGESCLQDFIRFTNKNQGRNVFLAHNSSGYDSILLAEEFYRVAAEKDINIINRGQKIMKLKVGKTLFLDTMLQLQGSLKSLAKGFSTDVVLEKGFFPHLFNTRENQYYRGPIPAKEFFDMKFVAKNQDDLDKFDAWYDEQTGKDWDFKEELVKYCENDVSVLACIVKKYHDIQFELTEIQPWGYTTAPSFAHDYIKKMVTLDYELDSLDPTKEDLDIQKSRIAEEKGWTNLFYNEYCFARKALRGGRTDVRCYYKELTSEEIARGVRIRYQDIVSQYPFQQIAHDFPVGTPMIEVYDMKMKPCVDHAFAINEDVDGCDCDFVRTLVNWKKPYELVTPTAEDIIEKAKTFGGFIYAEVTPPDNLYHPILISFDAKQNKAVASLERQQGHYTILEFVLALQNGYKLEKVYRIDWYRMAPGLWLEPVKQLYLKKMMYSRNLPDEKEQKRLIDAYEERFEMGDMLQRSFDKGSWEKNGARKLTAKIMLNSGWGKHAQRPFFDQTQISSVDSTDVNTLCENIHEKNYKMKEFVEFGDICKFVSTPNPRKLKPNLHDGYLPAAVYVPAYGRVQLWKELNKLGKRALYHDTDSIIYVYDPLEYNIPEGDILGDWEIEDVDKDNDGIVEFVSAGPKTYGLRTKENNQIVYKCKGLRLSRATHNLFNFEKIKENVLAGLNGDKHKLSIPQMNFTAKAGKGITTNYAFKTVGFDPDSQKGIVHGYYQYPKGYDLNK